MAKSISQFQRDVEQTIRSSNMLVIQLTRLSPATENHLKTALERLIPDHPDRAHLAFTITLECVKNAIEAIYKRVFFEDRSLDIFSETEYEAGMAAFAKDYSPDMAEEYSEKAKAGDKVVRIYLEWDASRLTIQVANTTPISPFEEEALRAKLRAASAFDDIASYYAVHKDGIGVPLIMILLKQAGMDPRAFRLITLPDATISRVEIPLH